MRMHSVWAAVALSLLLPTAAAPAEAQQPSAAGEAQPQQRRELSTLLSAMHAMNRLMVDVGKLAESRASHTDVRNLGERLRRDHQLAVDEIEDLAEELDVELQPLAEPPAPLQQAKRRTSELQALEGSAFDRSYVEFMVDAQSTLKAELQQAVRTTPIHAAALFENSIPIVDQHAELAEYVKARL